MENKINWIECNLPWSIDIDYTNAPKEKDINYDYDFEVDKLFPGFKDLKNKCKKIGFWNWVYDIQNKQNLSDFEFKNSEYAEHDNYISLLKFQEIERQISLIFGKNHPKMIAYKKALNEFEDNFIKNNPSFVGKKLNKPGTLVKLESGRILLIGNVNTFGCSYDDYQEIKSDDVIIAYSYILNIADLNKGLV